MLLQTVDINVFEIESLDDRSWVAALPKAGVEPNEIVAIVGKSEGSGSSVDEYREQFVSRLTNELAQSLDETPASIAEKIPIVISSGTYGALSPHIAVISRRLTEGSVSKRRPGGGRLVVGVAKSTDIAPQEIGRLGQINKVAAAVERAKADAGIRHSADVHCVLVKAPALDRQRIAECSSAGISVVAEQEGQSVVYSNDASALGVALALGEVREERLTDDAVRRDWDLYSEVAVVSAASERKRADVVLLGNSSAGIGRLRIGHGLTADLIDTNGLKVALRSAGLAFDCCPTPADQQRIVHVFAKLKVPADGRIRGRQTTIARDPEIARVTKSVAGGLFGSVVGSTTLFVSGGEVNSHQGPPNGSPVAAVVRH